MAITQSVARCWRARVRGGAAPSVECVRCILCARFARARRVRGARSAPRRASMGPSTRARRDPSGGNPEGGFARLPVRRARLERGRGGACVRVHVCAYECMTDVCAFVCVFRVA